MHDLLNSPAIDAMPVEEAFYQELWTAPGWSAREPNQDERLRWQAIARLIAIAPRFRLGTLRRIRFADTGRLQSDLARLRAAGLPD